jgi:hypothetical protein
MSMSLGLLATKNRRCKPAKLLFLPLIIIFVFLSSTPDAGAQLFATSFWKHRVPLLAFTTSAQTLLTSACSGSVTVQNRNASNVAANVTSNLTVTMGGAGLSFYSDVFCSSPISTVTIGTGTNSASFYFIGSIAGVANLTAAATSYETISQTETLTTNPFVWIGGGGDALWSTAANWSGGAAPGAADIAVFDGTCMSNCSPTISAGISISAVRMLLGYSGTITQNAGFTIALSNGTWGWVQNAGTFLGGTSNITLSGAFAILGGNFTSTTGSLIVANGLLASATVIKIASGVTFNANTGTVQDFGGHGICYCAISLSIDVDPSIIFNNFSISATTSGNWWYTDGYYGKDTHIAVNPLNISGNFTQNSSYLSGTFRVEKNLTVGTAAVSTGTPSGYIEIMGTTNQTYTFSSGKAHRIKVNKPSGTFEPAVGTTALSTSEFYLAQGSFTAPTGTFTVGAQVGSATTSTIFQIDSGTTFTHSSGTLSLRADLANCSYDSFHNINIASNTTVNNLTITGKIDSTCYWGVTNLNKIGAGTLTVIGTTTLLTAGKINNSGWALEGDLILNGSSLSGNASFLFSGSGTQTITSTAGSMPSGTFTVNKTGGSIVQATNLSKTGALTITAGTWDMAGYDLTLTSAINNSGSLVKGANPSCGVLTSGSYTGAAATCP